MLLKDVVTNGISYSVAMVSQDEDLTRDLQQRLVLWAYNPGPVDGDWGTRTQTAYGAWATANQFKPDEISPQAAARRLS
jgi:peptidoglycan hydrolase-like protein with peptidoglycan-binding domain